MVYVRLDADRAGFLQVLEGPQQVVEQTYARIGRDELHTDLTVLSRSPAETAQFEQWPMKFATLDEAGLRAAAPSAPGQTRCVWLRDRRSMDQVIASIGRH